MAYPSGNFFRAKFSFLVFFFGIRNYVPANSRYFSLKKSFRYIPGFFSVWWVFLFVVLFFFGLWFFFSENQFDGDIVYDSMIVASPGPRKVESLDLINNSVRMDVQLEENGAWA